MNSLGKNVPANKRVANLPVVVVPQINPRNDNAAKSAAAKPVNKAIPLQGYNGPYTYRNTMNNVDPTRDRRREELVQNVSQVAEYRRKDRLKPHPVLTNLRNVSDDNLGKVTTSSVY